MVSKRRAAAAATTSSTAASINPYRKKYQTSRQDRELNRPVPPSSNLKLRGKPPKCRPPVGVRKGEGVAPKAKVQKKMTPERSEGKGGRRVGGNGGGKLATTSSLHRQESSRRESRTKVNSKMKEKEDDDNDVEMNFELDEDEDVEVVEEEEEVRKEVEETDNVTLLMTLPTSSSDLPFPPDQSLKAVEIYDFLATCHQFLHLTPFPFEDYCTALSSEDKSSSLLNAIHIQLLEYLVRADKTEHDSQFGPPEAKDWVQARLVLFVDSLTWPEALRCYLESNVTWNDVHREVISVEYPFCGPEIRIKVLGWLVDQVMNTFSPSESDFESCEGTRQQNWLGSDLRGRKYWFLAQRLFVENEDGSEVWYYSTRGQVEALLNLLDPTSDHECFLVEKIEAMRKEIPDEMEEESHTVTARLASKLASEIAILTYKRQEEEEQEPKRHRRFSLSPEFQYGSEDLHTREQQTSALKKALCDLESALPRNLMYSQWPRLRKTWLTQVERCVGARDLARTMLIVSACIRRVAYNPVWNEGTGLLRFCRKTKLDRDAERDEKRERKAKDEAGEEGKEESTKGEEHDQKEWIWLSIGRPRNSPRQSPNLGLREGPHKCVIQMRRKETGKVEPKLINPQEYERLVAKKNVAVKVNSVDVCSSLSSEARRFFPKVARPSKYMDGLLERRNHLQQTLSKEIQDGTSYPVFLKKARNPTKRTPRQVYPPLFPTFCHTSTKKSDLLVLVPEELKRLARSGGRRFTPTGFLENQKSLKSNWSWALPCGRPVLRTAWQYKTMHANSLAEIAMQLRILYACLRWNDMTANIKTPTGDGKQKYDTDTEEITTEIVERRVVGRYGERVEYLQLKQVKPLYTPASSHMKLSQEPPSRSRLRLRKQPSKESQERRVNPVVTEQWVDEETVDLWQIRWLEEPEKRPMQTRSKMGTTIRQPPEKYDSSRQPPLQDKAVIQKNEPETVTTTTAAAAVVGAEKKEKARVTERLVSLPEMRVFIRSTQGLQNLKSSPDAVVTRLPGGILNVTRLAKK